jgi:serine/threonine protein kinase
MRIIVIYVHVSPMQGDLFDLLRHMGGRMKESDVVTRVLVPFMSGISYMHANGIIHRDIKLENTLFAADGTLKIADFGLSIDVTSEAPVTRLGTLDYMSPGTTYFLYPVQYCGAYLLRSRPLRFFSSNTVSAATTFATCTSSFSVSFYNQCI